MYIFGIDVIILYHQQHHNLTPLAHQSAWKILVHRFYMDYYSEEEIVNDLHFVGEAAKELKELAKSVSCKQKKGEERGVERKEIQVFVRWLTLMEPFFYYCQLWNEEFVGLIGSIAEAFKASKDNYRELCHRCIFAIKQAAMNRTVQINDLLNGGAFDVALVEIQRRTIDYKNPFENLQFFLNVSRRFKGKEDDDADEEKRKEMKRKVFEKLEEEGYEDTITSFYELFELININNHHSLSLNVSDYLVNV
ncbi:uncharacterized protein MONOS_12749 [Monocercomonoides exilis]|uniref:uncharacterized protein n=1 Tax=Monocercomonoides exilis TaxID=2049356 RepID=UPI00355981F9|nr:hypothetical protein MONOS_12749 [Monocercomonoides exilis]|eukprot:MONOS_12749.1-p1 / transcript=MONOS_12749.1 / gene=MONOS_12749 / organism=Monocercomonoides_exilis_PA203 / gene_product=unspecified product / transcript_product=unspecified product / location=Mono_scaffold00729:578-1327(-) / protein_length=250 / sequence_SO=supercontig / SO=protein_coding / is_pseudo=false